MRGSFAGVGIRIGRKAVSGLHRVGLQTTVAPVIRTGDAKALVAGALVAACSLASAASAQGWSDGQVLTTQPLLSSHGYGPVSQPQATTSTRYSGSHETPQRRSQPARPTSSSVRQGEALSRDLGLEQQQPQHQSQSSPEAPEIRALSNYAAGFLTDPDPMVARAARLYQQANYRPLWHYDTGWTDLGHGAYSLLARSVEDGLPRETYLNRMEQGLRQGAGAAEVAVVDFALTLGLLRFAIHLRDGLRADAVPANFDDGFKLAYRSRSVSAWLDSFRPRTPLYRALRTELATNRLTPFQTSKAAFAMHRERAPLLIHPEHHVVVDLGLQRLRVYEARRLSFELPVVVGTPDRKTPIMIDHIIDLKFSPEWTLPPVVVRQDLLPILARDPEQIHSMGIEIVDLAGQAIPATAVNWSSYGQRSEIPFRFRMSPSHPNNQLGGVRFSLTNDQAIFLHDSPDSARYGDGIRSLSSGCVRVGHAHLLALWIMAQQKAWTPEDVSRAMSSGKTTVERLPRPIPVNMIYSTVGLTEHGRLFFKPDIYGEDAQLARFLGLNLL